jgi:hypothetical protein
MNMMKTALMSTAFLASASVFANTAIHAQANASTEVQGSTHGVLHNIHEGVKSSTQKVGHGLSTATENVGQGLSTASERVGQGLEKGAEQSKSASQAAWHNTKQFSAKQTQNARQTLHKAKDSSADQAKRSQQYVGQKIKQGKATTERTWDKTKTALTTPAQADVNAQVGAQTPISKTQIGVTGQGSIHNQNN